jgi:hypothetical protein
MGRLGSIWLMGGFSQWREPQSIAVGTASAIGIVRIDQMIGDGAIDTMDSGCDRRGRDEKPQTVRQAHGQADECGGLAEE